MTRRAAVVLLVGLCTAWLSVTMAMAAPVGLLEALGRGLVTAEFRGAGDSGVTGTLVRQTPEPLQVVVSPGTVFRVQFGGGGYQGISSFGTTPIDMSAYRVAHVFIPGGCANFGLRAPGPSELMVPGPPPNQRMARLAQAIAKEEPGHPAAQIALWAVANNVPKWAMRRYVARTMLPHTSKVTIDARAAQLLGQAEGLIKKAGLEPKKFRAFR